MVLPKALEIFFDEQKARYGELFWYQTDGNKIILMIEKLAEKARAAFDAARAVIGSEIIENIEFISFELDDSIGEFYIVEAEQINAETRPSKQEYKSIMDRDLKFAFTDLTNDIYQNQLVRVFRPKGYQSFCVVVYHSFGFDAPRGPIGWIKNLNGLKKLDISNPEDYLRKSAFESAKIRGFEEMRKQLEGVKYKMGGGSNKNGFDCSSLAQRVFYETKGIWLPRKARWQQMVCDPVELNNLKQGDLVFFNKADDPKKEIDHVALVYEVQPEGRLPVVFHAKKLNGRAEVEDLNTASWLNLPTHSGGWEINSFGRVGI